MAFKLTPEQQAEYDKMTSFKEREEFLEQNREPSEEALGDDELLEPAIGEGLVETLAEELEEDPALAEP